MLPRSLTCSQMFRNSENIIPPYWLIENASQKSDFFASFRKSENILPRIGYLKNASHESEFSHFFANPKTFSPVLASWKMLPTSLTFRKIFANPKTFSPPYWLVEKCFPGVWHFSQNFRRSENILPLLASWKCFPGVWHFRIFSQIRKHSPPIG